MAMVNLWQTYLFVGFETVADRLEAVWHCETDRVMERKPWAGRKKKGSDSNSDNKGQMDNVYSPNSKPQLTAFNWDKFLC